MVGAVCIYLLSEGPDELRLRRMTVLLSDDTIVMTSLLCGTSLCRLMCNILLHMIYAGKAAPQQIWWYTADNMTIPAYGSCIGLLHCERSRSIFTARFHFSPSHTDY